MLEVKADLWTYPADYRCVTTNGVVKSNGELVMGAGVALDAARKFPELPARLGKLVLTFGNKPFILPDLGIISFPTKHDWRQPSSLELIEASAREILGFVSVIPWDVKIALPKIGTGLGNLLWDDVKPVLELYFGNNFIVCISK